MGLISMLYCCIWVDPISNCNLGYLIKPKFYISLTTRFFQPKCTHPFLLPKKIEILKNIKLPEDPINSIPEVSVFLFFSCLPVRGTMCNMVLFLKISGSIFTPFRPWHRPLEFVFLKEKWAKGSKRQILGFHVPVLIT